MILLIDAGNTRIKWICLPADAAMLAESLQADAIHTIDNTMLASAGKALQADLQRASAIWLCSVAGAVLNDWLATCVFNAPLHRIQACASALGVDNGYTQPAQLGSDRWCSLLAVWQQYRCSALVVNAGTALTIDSLSACAQTNTVQAARFMGGSIQPGLQLMWRSLQQGTAQLDYALPGQQPWQGWATDSQHAMWQGCLNALLGAIIWRYQQFSAQLPAPPKLILSGGDAALLYAQLPSALAVQAIIVDNLVLSGLAALADASGKAT